MNSVGNALYCVGGRGSRSNDLGAGRLCLAPLVGGGSWSGPAHGGTRLGGGGRVRGRVVGRTTWCLPTVRSRSCVDAWTGAASSGSFRAVAVVSVWGLGLMLHGGRSDYGKNTPDNVYSQGRQELNASAGTC